jgi:hypothetical protein
VNCHSDLKAWSDFDDSNGMFPLSALLSHAELNKRKSSAVESVEARRATRQTRYGNLTLFPRVEQAQPIAASRLPMDPPRVIASISNVSASGLGLILAEELPDGLEFDVDWRGGEFPVPLRFEVVHSQPMSAGLYRVGARLIVGIMPEEPVPTDFVSMEQPADPELEIGDDYEVELNEASPMVFAGGILKFDPGVPEETEAMKMPAPAGTMKASAAQGFDKTQTMDGVTTCGWERSISVRRMGDRLWLYIHSPGKKNGWGIFVDADQFESMFNSVQLAATSPFVASMAA